MSIRDNLDISAYLVLGPENTLGRPVGDVVAQALDAGFTCIQVRSKVASAREIIALTGDAAQAIAQAGKTGQVALLIDDRLDCVLAAREQGIAVDGVHVGQSDIPVEVCRKLLGPDAIVGLSARCEEMLEYRRYEFGRLPWHRPTPRDRDQARLRTRGRRLYHHQEL